jgi:hypothetical protein
MVNVTFAQSYTVQTSPIGSRIIGTPQSCGVLNHLLGMRMIQLLVNSN